MENKTIEAEIIETAPVLMDIKYPVSINDLDLLIANYKDIPNINPDAEDEVVAEQYQFVLKGHKSFVKARNQIENTRKELKAPALEYGKSVDNVAKEFQAKIKPIEEKLLIQRKIVEDNEARKQREAEEAEEARIESIKRSINQLRSAPMECIGKSAKVILEVLELLEVPREEYYEEYYDEGKTAYNASIFQIQQMHGNQLLVENAQKMQDEKDAEAKRLKDEEDAKLKAERDAFEADRKAFKNEQDEFERKQREVQEEADRKAAEQAVRDLERVQKENREKQAKVNEDKYEKRLKQTLSEMNKYPDSLILLDMIIDNKIPNVKWIPDEQ